MQVTKTKIWISIMSIILMVSLGVLFIFVTRAGGGQLPEENLEINSSVAQIQNAASYQVDKNAMLQIDYGQNFCNESCGDCSCSQIDCSGCDHDHDCCCDECSHFGESNTTESVAHISATLNPNTTYYANHGHIYTLSSSQQHYRCQNGAHQGANDYTTSSVSGTCYTSPTSYRAGYTTTKVMCVKGEYAGTRGHYYCQICGLEKNWDVPSHTYLPVCYTYKKCNKCGGDWDNCSCYVYSSTSVGHSIVASYYAYNYIDQDTGATVTSQTAFATATKYTIVFNRNEANAQVGGGTAGGSMSNGTYYHYYSQALPKTTYYMSNNTFMGWTTSPTSRTIEFFDGGTITAPTTLVAVNGTLNLYAVWGREAKVDFDISPTEYTYDGTAKRPTVSNVRQEISEVWDGTSQMPTKGSGTQADPYLVENGKHLKWIQQNATSSSGSAVGKYFKQINNINLGNRTWTPIGYNGLTIYYDGGYFCIVNFYISSSTSNYQALFSYLSGGYLKNLSIFGSINAQNYTAAFVSYVTSSSVVLEHLYNNANLTFHGSYCGGIVGYNAGDMKYCSNKGTIWGSLYCFGGICGYNDGKIQGCENGGNIYIDSSYNGSSPINTSSYIGGLVGYQSSFSSTKYVYDCLSFSSINYLSDIPATTYIGGCVGIANYSYVLRCCNQASLGMSSSGTNSGKYGAICGQGEIRGTCLWLNWNGYSSATGEGSNGGYGRCPSLSSWFVQENNVFPSAFSDSSFANSGYWRCVKDYVPQIKDFVNYSPQYHDYTSSEYTVTYGTNIAAGTGTVTVTTNAILNIAGEPVITSQTITKTFPINKKDYTPTISMNSYTYGGTKANPNIASGEGDYSFVLNNNGYYESNNKGVHNSFAYAKVSFTLSAQQDVTIDVINYAEGGFDYGLFSNIDTELVKSYSDVTTNVFKSYKDLSQSGVQTLTYSSVSAGSHYITIKYKKDSSQNSNNDTLQFKFTSPTNITIKGVDFPENPTVIYYYNTSNAVGGTPWSNVTDASSLEPGTYYMSAYIQENSEYVGKWTGTTQFKVYVPYPTMNTTSYQWTGSAITPSAEFDHRYVYCNSSATNVGSYTAYFYTYSGYYFPNGGTSKTFSYSITKRIVDLPSTGGDFDYDGTTKNAITEYDSNYVQIVSASSTLSAIMPGSYNVVFSLKNTSYSQWSDGTTGNKVEYWQIYRNSVQFDPYQMPYANSWIYGDQTIDDEAEYVSGSGAIRNGIGELIMDSNYIYRRKNIDGGVGDSDSPVYPTIYIFNADVYDMTGGQMPNKYWINVIPEDTGYAGSKWYEINQTANTKTSLYNTFDYTTITPGRYYMKSVLNDNSSVLSGTNYYYNNAYNTLSSQLFEFYVYLAKPQQETYYTFRSIGDGWYESTNQYINASVAYCKFEFNMLAAGNLEILYDVECEGEEYDYAQFFSLDSESTVFYSVGDWDSAYYYAGAYVGTLTYSNVSAGNHYIVIKYFKDGSGHNGRDTLQFKFVTQIVINQATGIGTNSTDIIYDNQSHTPIINDSQGYNVYNNGLYDSYLNIDKGSAQTNAGSYEATIEQELRTVVRTKTAAQKDYESIYHCDVLSGIPINTITPTSISNEGSSYGFTLNSWGYYESTNQGISGSTAICMFTFTLSSEQYIILEYHYEGEDNCRDYADFYALDSTSSVYYTEGEDGYCINSNQIHYGTVSAGTHYILVKYIKDGSVDEYRDSVMFKIGTVPGAGCYGFGKDVGNGYYYSVNNDSIDEEEEYNSTCSYTKVFIYAPSACNVIVDAVVSSEDEFDWAMISCLDVDLFTYDDDIYAYIDEGEMGYYWYDIFDNIIFWAASGEVSERVSIPVSAGSHFLTFAYYKDGSVFDYDDCFSFKIMQNERVYNYQKIGYDSLNDLYYAYYYEGFTPSRISTTTAVVGTVNTFAKLITTIDSGTTSNYYKANQLYSYYRGQSNYVIDSSFVGNNDGKLNKQESIEFVWTISRSYYSIVTYSWRILPRNIADCTIVLNQTNFIYNGQVQVPSVTITDPDI